MNDFRLTFNSSTNFTIPIGSFNVLEYDAARYNYIKNDKPNISGFLNELLPVLSDYQEDLYKKLLQYNNGNENITKAVARSIHNIYLQPFNFHDDGVVNVPFRISKDKYDDFITIHDERLLLYDTNFTGYIRTLLVEYTSKTFSQREYLFAFRKLKDIRSAINRQQLCRFYSSAACDVFVPVSIETSPVSDCNYIVGITTDMQPIAIKLSSLQKIVLTPGKIIITNEMCALIYDFMEKIYQKEYAECLD